MSSKNIASAIIECMGSDFDTEKVIREYLPQIIHMSLATTKEDRPWVCEVHYVYDDQLNLYFRSMPSRRHSQEIALNPHVAGNIVMQHEQGVAPRGVYFEGTAERLEEINETNPVYDLFRERFGLGPAIVEEARQPDGHKFYKITVSDFYVFDARESKPSQKYYLAWSKKA